MPLLASIRGAQVPAQFRESWAACCNMSFVGPGTGIVRIENNDGVRLATIWNVIATIEGAVEPDRVVVLGSHRDAWTFGAGDPISGHSVLLETARVLGQLMATQNWRPRRTIKLCSWDAEEEALIGSVEFVEKNFRSLQMTTVAYRK
jgi:N-acetylated-alpha-linked acidic dipeptidase